jgi:hypothetical protein
VAGQRGGGLNGQSAEIIVLFMKANLFLLCFASALTAYAADPPGQLNSTLRTPIEVTQSERFQALIAHSKPNPSAIAIGRSDFVLSGQLVYGFRRLPHEEGLTKTQRFLRLPVIRLFVPGPMPNPPESGGRYFAWKSEESRTLAWTTAASRPGIIRGPESSVSLDTSRVSIHP